MSVATSVPLLFINHRMVEMFDMARGTCMVVKRHGGGETATSYLDLFLHEPQSRHHPIVVTLQPIRFATRNGVVTTYSKYILRVSHI